jgi:hypothetical protein
VTSRWTNPHQPQTLQIGVLLLYFRAIFSLIGLSRFSLPLAVGMGAAGFGIANEKKWGYILGVAVSILPILVDVQLLLDSHTVAAINLLFDVALLALLLHPMSRDYQRIWFK